MYPTLPALFGKRSRQALAKLLKLHPLKELQRAFGNQMFSKQSHTSSTADSKAVVRLSAPWVRIPLRQKSLLHNGLRLIRQAAIHFALKPLGHGSCYRAG